MSARAAMTISLFKMEFLKKSDLSDGVMRLIIDRWSGALWAYLQANWSGCPLRFEKGRDFACGSAFDPVDNREMMLGV